MTRVGSSFGIVLNSLCPETINSSSFQTENASFCSIFLCVNHGKQVRLFNFGTARSCLADA